MRTFRLQSDDAVRPVTRAQEVAIHPDYRGGKIVRTMFRANETTWKAAGIPFVFGFPTPEHMQVAARTMGYRELFRLTTWQRNMIRGVRLQERLHAGRARRAAYAAGSLLQQWTAPRRPRVGGAMVRMADLLRFDGSLDKLWERIRGQVRFAIVRDAAYLSWRYLNRPSRPSRVLGATRRLQLDGYCVFRDDVTHPDGWRAGAVTDLVAIVAATAGALFHAALGRMRKACCIHALTLDHSAMVTAPIPA